MYGCVSLSALKSAFPVIHVKLTRLGPCMGCVVGILAGPSGYIGNLKEDRGVDGCVYKSLAVFLDY